MSAPLHLVSVIADTPSKCAAVIGDLTLVESCCDARSEHGFAVLVAAEPEIARRLVDTLASLPDVDAEVHEYYVPAVQAIFATWGTKLDASIVKRTASPALPVDVAIEAT